MKILDLKQDSKEWREWRKGRITSTDAAILCGKSRYSTPYQNWYKRIHNEEELPPNSAMLRGINDEPIARGIFIKEYGINVKPTCIESEKHYFLGASLDGLSDCGKYMIEVKSQPPVVILPEMHNYQIQHAMFTSDGHIEKCFYVSHWEGKNIYFEVFPDEQWQKQYLPRADKYWENIIYAEPPALTSRDYKDMDGVEDWEACACEYVKVNSEIKALESIRDALKDNLIRLCCDQSAMGAGLKVLKKYTKGRIDYKEAAETLNMPEGLLETCRKPASFSWTIMVDKK